MDINRKRTQAALLSVVVLALACSVSAQQPPQPQPPQPQPPQPQPVECNVTTTKPNPAQQSYVFQTCIVAKFGAFFSVGPDRYVELKNGAVNKSSSTCGANATNPKLVVEFDCAQLEFEFQTVNKSFSVKSINGFYQLDKKSENFSNSTELFTASEGHYYKCNAEQTVSTATNQTKLVLSNVAYEAFRPATGTDFYRVPEECALDSSGASDLVRIGVGIALVLLAALVLVAYFVGRRRWAERSSYESV